MEGFAIISWDWKAQFDTEDFSDALNSIDGPADITDIDTNSDQIAVAIFSKNYILTEEEWGVVYWASYTDPKFPGRESRLNSTPLTEMRAYIVEKLAEEARELEQEKQEERAKKENEERKQLAELQKKYGG